MAVDPERPWCDRARPECVASPALARFQISDADAVLLRSPAHNGEHYTLAQRQYVYEQALLIDWQIVGGPRPATPVSDAIEDDWERMRLRGPRHAEAVYE